MTLAVLLLLCAPDELLPAKEGETGAYQFAEKSESEVKYENLVKTGPTKIELIKADDDDNLFLLPADLENKKANRKSKPAARR